jgi:hypothetical protein
MGELLSGAGLAEAAVSGVTAALPGEGGFAGAVAAGAMGGLASGGGAAGAADWPRAMHTVIIPADMATIRFLYLIIFVCSFTVRAPSASIIEWMFPI